MKKLMVEDDGLYLPKDMCSINRYGEVDDWDGCGEVCENFMGQGCENCPIQEAFNRLAKYEETGLTPEQVKAAAGLIGGRRKGKENG